MLSRATTVDDTAADRYRCDAMATRLRRIEDPFAERTSDGHPKLTVTRVERVYDADHDGLTEVLFRDGDHRPLTAYMRHQELVSIADGW